MNTTIAANTLLRDRLVVAGEIFIATVIPVILLQLGLIQSQYRIITFGAFFLTSIISIVLNRITPIELGLRRDNLSAATREFGIQVIILCLVTIVGVNYLGGRGLISPRVASVLSPAEYILISVPVQQFVYYAWLHARLTTVTNSRLVQVLVMGFLFSLMHVPWQSTSLTVATAFLGLLWAYLYNRNPNLFASLASHAITGGVALVALQMTIS